MTNQTFSKSKKSETVDAWMRSSIHTEKVKGASSRRAKAEKFMPDFGPENFIFPVFVSDSTDENLIEPIQALPGQFKCGTASVVEYLRPFVEHYNLKTVILFGVVESKYAAKKDAEGSLADAVNISFSGYLYTNPVIRALQRLKAAFADLLLIADVCLCSYSTGHCGIMKTVNGQIVPDAEASHNRLASVAATYAIHGADIIAPSDMISGRIGPIRRKLDASGYSHVSIMSYSVKYCSAFYGPFRSAVQSNARSTVKSDKEVKEKEILHNASYQSMLPMFSAKNDVKYFDRSSYQLDPRTADDNLKQIVLTDVAQGAAFVMIKPSTCYLDIVHRVSEIVEVPVGVYHTSGEYCQLFYAAHNGAIDLSMVIEEIAIAYKRSGVKFIISYFTPFILKKMKGEMT